jgi:hypothetical protein
MVVTLIWTCVALDPFKVTEGDIGAQLAFAGAPLHEIVMVWLKPFIGVSVKVYAAPCPGLTFWVSVVF